MRQERPLVTQLPQGGSISRQRVVVSGIFNKSKQMDSGSFIETLPNLLLKYPLMKSVFLGRAFLAVVLKRTDRSGRDHHSSEAFYGHRRKSGDEQRGFPASDKYHARNEQAGCKVD